MPINVSSNLPAVKALEAENIFILAQNRASSQDIRPLRMLIFNLMPTKITTETQLLRLLSNTPLQIEVDFLQTSTYTSKNTSEEHLDTFYNTFDEIKHKKYDGIIVTGAPVEHFDYEDVAYIKELKEIFDWTKTNVFSSLYICWGALAALNHFYNIPKVNFSDKLSGVFQQSVEKSFEPIFRQFDDIFNMPHSRNSGVNTCDILSCPDLEILATSDKTGPSVIASTNRRNFFITGHMEYDDDTLKNEYLRDISSNLDAKIPENYFENDDPLSKIKVTWRSHAGLFYSNWVNMVYQETPFDLNNL